MSRLKKLLDDVQSALEQRLREIGAEQAKQMRLLEEQEQARFKQACQALARKREQQIGERIGRMRRHAEEAEKGRLWSAEQALFDDLVAAVCDALASRKPSQSWFDARLAAARRRFPAHSKLRLGLNETWRAHVRIRPEYAVQTEPMLGGFRLTDTKRGIELDATWERRLEDIKGDLWERWHGCIENYQD